MRKIIFALILAIIPQSALADFAVGTGNFPYSAPSSLTTNCVIAASSSTALTCTVSPTINGTNINAATIPSSALGTVAVAQGGTNLTSLVGSKCIRSASTTALAETSGDCLVAGTAVTIPQGGTGQTTANAALNALLPSQTGNATKVLQTDGTNSSWVAGGTGTVTAVTASGNLASSGGTTPAITMTASPTFTNTLTTQGCVGTVCATGVGANDLSVANGTGGKIWIGSAGTNFLNLSGSTLQVGGGNLAILSGNSITTGNSTFGSTTISSGGTMQAKIGGVVSYVPPVYVAAGTVVASTMHCIADTVTAGGISTTVTLSSPAAFASANYALVIEDETGLSSVLPTAQSAGSFTFTSINAHVYAFHACAP